VIGAFGKRFNLDVKMNEDFYANKRAPYLDVKRIIKDHSKEKMLWSPNFEGVL